MSSPLKSSYSIFDSWLIICTHLNHKSITVCELTLKYTCTFAFNQIWRHDGAHATSDGLMPMDWWFNSLVYFKSYLDFTFLALSHFTTSPGLSYFTTYSGLSYSTTYSGLSHFTTYSGLSYFTSYLGLCHFITFPDIYSFTKWQKQMTL